MPTAPAWRLRSSFVGHSYAGSAMSICAECSFEWRAGEAAANTTVVQDSNGNMRRAGDTVTVIKDLKVKGPSIPLGQGTIIRNIGLVENNAGHIGGNSEKTKGLVLNTCFLRKA